MTQGIKAERRNGKVEKTKRRYIAGDEMVIENDKKMKELVNEEHHQVKHLAEVVDEMKRHDKELENELQKYKAIVEIANPL